MEAKELEAIRERVKAATPGPWVWEVADATLLALGRAAATPDRPVRGALALRCEHGNRWRYLAVYHMSRGETAWCSPVLDGCTVEMLPSPSAGDGVGVAP